MISAFFARQIISVMILMIIYMGIIVYALSEVEVWNSKQIKNTVFWCASVGFLSLFKLESIRKNKHFFKHFLISNLGLIAVFQFIVAVFTFSLWVEIILLPIVIMSIGMIFIAGSDVKHTQVKKFLEYLLSVYGFMIIANVAYLLVINLGEIANKETAYDFIVPPLLTLLYLPFIFVMIRVVFLNYVLFFTLKFHIPEANIINISLTKGI